jgi:hypothetical protein
MDDSYVAKDCEGIMASAKKEGADRLAHIFKGQNKTCFPKINFANLTVRYYSQTCVQRPPLGSKNSGRC